MTNFNAFAGSLVREHLWFVKTFLAATLAVKIFRLYYFSSVV